MKKRTPWVMESTPKQLANIVRDELSRIDDWQQDACDNGNTALEQVLTDAYNFLENTLNAIVNKKRMTAKKRNSIRMEMKHYNRMVMVELYSNR